MRILFLALCLLISVLCPLISAFADTHYVSTNGLHQTPFTNWVGAASNIQAAIDVSSAGDTVLVTNGVYETGGRVVYGAMTNRVAITNAITVVSVNGSAVTTIKGGGVLGDRSVRCAYLAGGARLEGFTLTGGRTRKAGDNEREMSGGGAWSEPGGVVSNCVLSGNLASQYGAGAYGGTLDDCVMIGNSANGSGGGAYGSTLNRCTISSNYSYYSGGGTAYSTQNHCTLSGNFTRRDGGGADHGMLNNCTLSDNLASDESTGNWRGNGGAAANSILSNCILSGNSAYVSAGGAYDGTLDRCTLINNSALYGGGANDATLNRCTLSGNRAGASGGGMYYGALSNCVLVGNRAGVHGGGAYQADLNNCALSGNSAREHGGGTYGGTLSNCTLTGNSAVAGGGAANGVLANCVLWFNTALYGPNHDGSTMRYCCATPPPPGTGNTDGDPLLASAWHLSIGSPCIGKGSTNSGTGVDLDGELWANPPSMGCDEVHVGTITGGLSAAIVAVYTQVTAGFEAEFTAAIEGRPTASRWAFGDGAVVSNKPYVSHSWSATGSYLVVLTAFNESNPGGVGATVTVGVVEQPVHYVAVGTPAPMIPYTSWATAATNIQDAVDTANTLGALILVSNGVYNTGGRAVIVSLTNRLVVDKPVEVRSVNGPETTVIKGQGPLGNKAARCAYVAKGAVLAGFTLTNGYTLASGTAYADQRGGGVVCEPGGVVSNCVLTGNSASEAGGGVCYGMLNNCTLSGNRALGSYSDGGGAYYCTLNNCTLSGNLAERNGGGAHYGSLSNCALEDNSASNSGGGVFNGVLDSCTLTSNTAYDGGGVHYGVLSNCFLTGNFAQNGGGARYATLSNCTLTGNSAANSGGGSSFGTLNNCTLAGNSAASHGGGASGGSLNNCALIGNSAVDIGGGAAGCTLSNCTLTGNTSGYLGGGVSGGTMNNCILWYNTAWGGPNYDGGTFRYCCTTPLPPGTGNISQDPLLASVSHLSSGSPCIGKGSTNYATGVDIDGEPWGSPPSIGCDEVRIGAVTGDLTVAISAMYTQMVVGFEADFTALIEGRTTASQWTFGDGVAASNRPYVSHAWSAIGSYAVVLTAVNESYPDGISATVTAQVVARPVHYVAPGNASPLAPYISWATAATTIQDAVDAAGVAGALVLVTNGLYDTGGRAVYGAMTNRVVIDTPIEVRSVNGPAVTVIKGQGPLGAEAVRCAYLNHCSVLSGFTLTNGCVHSSGDYSREQSGGGAWCEPGGVISNCTLTGNSAMYSGGGAYYGILNNCALIGNSASNSGGGAYFSTLNSCALSGNSAVYGGGVYLSILNSCALNGNLAFNSGGGAGGASTLNSCTLVGNAASNSGGGTYYGTLYNCILWENTAQTGSNYHGATLSYCCTRPMPGGVGNITNEPQFVADNDFHLIVSSPCINRGVNQAWMFDATDLDGHSRILLGTADMGCYEMAPQLSLKVLLQGAYLASAHRMGDLLAASAAIPLTAPYAADPRVVAQIPTNATDWMLIEARSSNGAPQSVQSAFVQRAGLVCSHSGSGTLTVEVPEGSYYLVAKHRNHLAAMSAQPVAVTNLLTLYDFSSGSAQFYGGTNAAVELESGVWGMIAGDADGDGKITWVDRAIVSNQVGKTGYLSGDLNLDGVVHE